jgi:hypothetical protein
MSRILNVDKLYYNVGILISDLFLGCQVESCAEFVRSQKFENELFDLIIFLGEHCKSSQDMKQPHFISYDLILQGDGDQKR